MRVDDPRVLAAKPYLRGARLVWKRWEQTHEDWFFDVCAFCGLKVADDGGQEAARCGYATAKDIWWVCLACAEVLQDRFGWELVGGPD